MTHYHVWFALKPEVPEAEGLGFARAFIAELLASGSVVHGWVMKNAGDPAKSRLPPYHALFEFRNDEQMNAAFAAKRVGGIHAGPHGRLLASVVEFRVEIFRSA